MPTLEQTVMLIQRGLFAIVIVCAIIMVTSSIKKDK